MGNTALLTVSHDQIAESLEVLEPEPVVIRDCTVDGRRPAEDTGWHTAVKVNPSGAIPAFDLRRRGAPNPVRRPLPSAELSGRNADCWSSDLQRCVVHVDPDHLLRPG